MYKYNYMYMYINAPYISRLCEQTKYIQVYDAVQVMYIHNLYGLPKLQQYNRALHTQRESGVYFHHMFVDTDTLLIWERLRRHGCKLHATIRETGNETDIATTHTT